MKVHPLDLEGVLLIEPKRFQDRRGFFSETYNAAELARHGFASIFVQDNHSLSTAAGTVRGLHFQAPPFAQAKLVRAVRGAIRDVAVDIRRGSPTYGRHVSVELSAENRLQLLIPEGFAHGFATLRPLTEVAYKVSAPYAPAHDRGIAWDDPALGIDWPVTHDEAVLSPKDASLPTLAELDNPFFQNSEDEVAA